MSQNLLTLVLSNKSQAEQVLHWISSSEGNLQNEFSCSRGEFISHLLNFIHEEALCFEKYRETPKKVHTPKSIRKLEVATKPRRRPALFSETHSPRLRNINPHDWRSEKPDRSDKTEKNFCPLSPVSPLYTHLNLPGENSPVTITPKSKNLCLGDFISPSRTPASGKRERSEGKSILSTPQSSHLPSGELRKPRRINPTNVAQRKSLNTQNSFDFQNQDVLDASNQNLPQVAKKSGECREIKEIKTNVIVPKAQQKEITPDLTKATQREQLETLITLYVELINGYRVLNVTSELYFIITLLLSKQYDSDVFPSKIFASIHNVLYFAVHALLALARNAESVLKLLDKSSLRLLASNERVKSLDASLSSKLAGLSDASEDSPRAVPQSPKLDKVVCFDSETDNRENFPSDASFHAFRKQRDMFYEILSAWEANRSVDGWSFAVGMGGKVRTLVGMHADAANYRHLSRLVKSQLLITCAGIHDESLRENQLAFFTTLPHVNAEKLNRLKTRLVSKDQSHGINSPPSFPGSQEFYRDLVLQAQSHVFCVHLRNVLIQDLLQLNETTWETETDHFDAATKANYCLVVKQLQLLAKFVSFIESLPYRSAIADKSEKTTSEEVERRRWMAPPIDLHDKLTTASRKGQLLLVIPWLTEYLAMLDASSLRLPYYEPIFAKLFAIFISAERNGSCDHQLIGCCLGWLFEQQHFPSEYYFRFLDFGLASEERVPAKQCRGMVDLAMLHSLCPFLKEFKKLLQYNCNRNGSISSKHITPVTAIENLNGGRNERRLKLQLQEAFLNSKPSSLRKTLEFVSERIASCIVKTVCNSVVPGVKTKALSEKKRLFAKHAQGEADSALKMQIKQDLSRIIETHLTQLKLQAEEVLTTQIDGRIRPAVVSMLCGDELEETAEVCVRIARRTCEDRVKQWIDTRVNAGVFKEFDLDLDKIDKALQKEREQKAKSLPTHGRANVPHVDSDDEGESAIGVWNPSKLMTELQRRNARLLRSASHAEDDVGRVRGALERCRVCRERREDLSDIAWHQINQLLLDYVLLLCKNSPVIVTRAVLDDLVRFWKENSEDYLRDVFGGVVSVRNNVILMAASKENLGGAWKCYASLLALLLKEKLLVCEDFESQCLSVFRENWDSATLERFCQCLRDVVETCGSKNEFSFLLAFLADYCADLDF